MFVSSKSSIKYISQRKMNFTLKYTCFLIFSPLKLNKWISIEYENLNLQDSVSVLIEFFSGIILKMIKFIENFKISFLLTKYIYVYINLTCLSVCLSVWVSDCLYPINVKTAEPIGPKFCVGHLGTPGKVYEWTKFQIFVSIKIQSSLNFWKFWKSKKFFVKIRELFLFSFTMYTKRTCSQLI